jgi:hypothetical protein
MTYLTFPSVYFVDFCGSKKIEEDRLNPDPISFLIAGESIHSPNQFKAPAQVSAGTLYHGFR